MSQHLFEENYQQAANIDSFKVGIAYINDFEDEVTEHNQERPILLPLDDEGKCLYRIYLKNNTSRSCEVKIFISQNPKNEIEKYSNHLLMRPHRSYRIERPDSINRRYTFVAKDSKIYKELGYMENDCNSQVTVKIYPEKRQDPRFSSTLLSQRRLRGIKVESDFGIAASSNQGEVKPKYLMTKCQGEVKPKYLMTKCPGEVKSKYLKAKCMTSRAVGGVTVLGEKSTQKFINADEIVKEGSSFTYKFVLSGLVNPNYIRLHPYPN